MVYRRFGVAVFCELVLPVIQRCNPNAMTRYSSIRVFISTCIFVLILLLLLRRIEGISPYEHIGWISFCIFGLWSYIVVPLGVKILSKSPNDPFFLSFQMAVTGMKFFLLIIIMLFYGKYGAPESRKFAWYLLATFLPFFIYETWAFSGMSRVRDK